MFIEEICALTGFLSNGRRSIDEIGKYLILHTFNEFKPQAIYLGQLESDGNLVLKSSFGFEHSYISQWNRIPLSIDIPINNAIRHDQVYVYPNQEDFFSQNPAVDNLGTISRDWTSCFAAPVQTLGSYFVVLNGKINAQADFEVFARTIGNLLALNFLDISHRYQGVSDASETPFNSKKLTERQELIRNLLIKGYTNPQIAIEIGYSESLVRHETIAI